MAERFGVYARKEADKPNDLLTVTHTARLLTLSEITIRALSDQGRLACIRTSAGHRLYRRRDIEKYAAQRESKGNGDGVA